MTISELIVVTGCVLKSFVCCLTPFNQISILPRCVAGAALFCGGSGEYRGLIGPERMVQLHAPQPQIIVDRDFQRGNNYIKYSCFSLWGERS